MRVRALHSVRSAVKPGPGPGRLREQLDIRAGGGSELVDRGLRIGIEAVLAEDGTEAHGELRAGIKRRTSSTSGRSLSRTVRRSTGSASLP